MINVTKLSKELVVAGISTHGNCNSNGVVWDDTNKEIQTRPDVKAIIDKHDPSPEIIQTIDERLSKIEIELSKKANK